MTLGSDIEKTEVWTGIEDIISKSIKVISRTKHTFDLCTDSTGPTVTMNVPMIKDAYFDMNQRGVKIRHITEIIKDNLADTSEFMKAGEVRHMDGVVGNFVVADGSDYAGAPTIEKDGISELLVSNVDFFVKQQQYFFDLLWAKAIPAEQRIKEIQEGRETEKTEVWRDEKMIIGKTLEVLANSKKGYDFCIDWRGPSIITSFDYMKKAYLDIVARGGKLRLITEIIPQNISFCEEIAGFIEIRHLDNIRGNFGIVDGKVYGGTSATNEGQAPSSYLHSNVKEFVEQQQYFFDMLWEKSIPARERISEIRDGIKPAKIVVIRDVRASLGLAFDIMNVTKKEFAVLFATPRTFIIAMKTGVAKLYAEMIARGVKIRILVPRSSADDQLNDIISEVKKTAPLVDLRLSDGDLNTRISLMVADRKEFIAWELKDDTKDDPYEAGGVATYSNSEALASSYATIFDNLWNIVDIAENLVEANLKLHESQKAMKEFINIAAHELRTPIQPILGLAEVLADKSSKKTIENEHGDSQLLRVIVRNAKRLQDLSDKILDVTKIESNSLSLKKEKTEINKLLAQVLEDAKTSLANSNNVNIHCEYFSQPIVVNGDPTRIAQVISNLVDNALKFTQSGSVRLMVQLDGVDKVIVKVHDTGMGIDPLVLPRIFEKFVSKSERGTGLGLFICKSIIEAHGGKIWAENNKDGIGATVAFSLPITH